MSRCVVTALLGLSFAVLAAGFMGRTKELPYEVRLVVFNLYSKFKEKSLNELGLNDRYQFKVPEDKFQMMHATRRYSKEIDNAFAVAEGSNLKNAVKRGLLEFLNHTRSLLDYFNDVVMKTSPILPYYPPVTIEGRKKHD